jgi:uncharacterized protein (DUF1800 family)
MSLLDELPFGSAFPNGYSDYAADWVGPQQLTTRLALGQFIANTVSQRSANQISAETAMAASVGPLMSTNSATALAKQTDSLTKTTLLFTCPEFQRR